MVLASPLGAALLVTAGAAAQTFEFVPIAGGAVSDLAYDPHSAGLVFAAVHGVGIYKSTDGQPGRQRCVWCRSRRSERWENLG